MCYKNFEGFETKDGPELFIICSYVSFIKIFKFKAVTLDEVNHPSWSGLDFASPCWFAQYLNCICG